MKNLKNERTLIKVKMNALESSGNGSLNDDMQRDDSVHSNLLSPSQIKCATTVKLVEVASARWLGC